MIFTSSIRGPAQQYRFIRHSGRAKNGLSKTDQFAEYLAEGYPPSEAAYMVYGDSTYGNAMLQRLRKRMGGQSQ